MIYCEFKLKGSALTKANIERSKLNIRDGQLPRNFQTNTRQSLKEASTINKNAAAAPDLVEACAAGHVTE